MDAGLVLSSIILSLNPISVLLIVSKVRFRLNS